MQMWSSTLLVAAGLAASAAAVSAAEPQGLTDLREAVPGLRVATDGATRLYGKPMAFGATPAQAVDAFLAEHADAFGVDQLELNPAFVTDTMNGKFTVFGYTQTIGGVPVEGGNARILVLNGQQNKVVYASGTLANATPLSLGAPVIEAEDAALIARAAQPVEVQAADAIDPGEWFEPELVVHQAPGGPVLAWEVGYSNISGKSEPIAFTNTIDAQTGEIIHTHNDVHTIDVEGNASGLATPGAKPDIASNPPIPTPMAKLILSIGGNDGVSDVNGDFTIPNGGAGQVTVNSNVSNGLWVNVNNDIGSDLSASDAVTPPGPADVVFNASPTEFNTSQVNAFVQTTKTHDYVKDRAPNFNALDIAIPANVNRFDLPCNAFFSGDTINFMRNGNGCNNTAYSTVISHEYGHFIVDQLGLGQGGFGEGYSDTVAMMIFDVCIVGENFFTNGGFIRNPCTANQQFPCTSSSVHTCGQILGGTWGEIRDSFKANFGSGPGLDQSRDLHVGWTLITSGGTGSNNLNSAHPGTAIEVLTIDDNDGDLGNGTPNFDDICAAFAEHGIDCPEVNLLQFTYSPPIPASLEPGQATTFSVQVDGVSATPESGTGTSFISIDGGNFDVALMNETSPNVYDLVIPALDCGQTVEFFVTAETTAGDIVTDPDGENFAPIIATLQETAFADDFESNQGWTVGAPGDDATTGVWERVNPLGTAAQPEDDHTPGAGNTDCFITGQQPFGGDLGTNDVDNGKTTLISPNINLEGSSGAVISYVRWYSNDTGNQPNANVFKVDVSDDGGATWTNVETVGPSGDEVIGGWIPASFTVEQFVDLTNEVRVRFVAEDDPSDGEGSIVEAGVDDFNVERFECEQIDCPADFNGDGEANILDFVAFQGAFAAGDSSADCNGDDSLNILDFTCFQAVFAAGCP